jgi:hypothetical protein
VNGRCALDPATLGCGFGDFELCSPNVFEGACVESDLLVMRRCPRIDAASGVLGIFTELSMRILRMQVRNPSMGQVQSRADSSTFFHSPIKGRPTTQPSGSLESFVALKSMHRILMNENKMRLSRINDNRLHRDSLAITKILERG